jgi:transposase
MLSQLDTMPKLYIGLDIHKKSCSVSIRTDLFDHKTFSMPPNSDALYDYVADHFTRYQVEICYEAGCCGFSAARAFLNFGWSVKVVNPADVPGMNKQNYQKTDKIDSRNLAKQHQNQSLHPIHIPTEDQEQFRSLLRQRNTITKQLRKAKTHIKSMLLFHGIEIPPQFDNANWTNEFKQWIKDIKWSNPCGQKLKFLKTAILCQHLE